MKIEANIVMLIIIFLCFGNEARAAWSESGGSSIPPLSASKYKLNHKGSGNIYTTKSRLSVRSDASIKSPVIDTYQAGAIMTYFGEAIGTGFVYVRPCNACTPGYISKETFMNSIRQ